MFRPGIRTNCIMPRGWRWWAALLLTEIYLIPAKGVIFSPDLLAQGKDGGHRAGQMLSESVRQQFLDAFNLDISRVHFWVHIFYNKRGLMDAIGQAGHPAAKQGFEDFTIGFNEAGLRFVMVDVSYGKDKVDKKITAMLEDYVRFPQICKILFGGEWSNLNISKRCH